MTAAWITADWPAPDNIVAGTTTRIGGVSRGVYATLNLGGHVGDDAEHVAENRRRFVQMCGLDAEPDWLRQIHGSTVRVPGGDVGCEADAAIERRPGRTAAVLTADCLPVLLCAADGGEIAAIHAGWRGLAAGVVARTLTEMHTPPAQLLAWLGPAISQPAFEVGDEVRAAFTALDESSAACFERNTRGRWQADLYALARRQLRVAGVPAVYGGGLCTYADAGRFFSFRRDGECGRMASFVARKR